MEETPKALRVAVVEDDPRIQQLISAEITDEGHACICFGSAEDFLDEAGSDRFDLLLLDLMLPGMDGVWGENFYGDDNLLDVYIRYLRQKVELDDAPTLINTVRGVGFILREQTN